MLKEHDDPARGNLAEGGQEFIRAEASVLAQVIKVVGKLLFQEIHKIIEFAVGMNSEFSPEFGFPPPTGLELIGRVNTGKPDPMGKGGIHAGKDFSDGREIFPKEVSRRPDIPSGRNQILVLISDISAVVDHGLKRPEKLLVHPTKGSDIMRAG